MKAVTCAVQNAVDLAVVGIAKAVSDRRIREAIIRAGDTVRPIEFSAVSDAEITVGVNEEAIGRIVDQVAAWARTGIEDTESLRWFEVVIVNAGLAVSVGLVD